MKKEEIKDLEILEKYLSEEELKDVAKNVAYRYFETHLGSKNPHYKDNYDFYLMRGALLAVQEHIKDFDKDELAKEMQKKTLALIKSLKTYNLPNNYIDIARDHIVKNKKIITNKIDLLISEFVNAKDYNKSYMTFTEFIGEEFANLLSTMLEKEYKTK